MKGTQALDRIIDRCPLLCLALALPVTALLGIGEPAIASLLGLLLCAAGIFRCAAGPPEGDALPAKGEDAGLCRVDLWVLGAFLVYIAMSAASALAAWGSAAKGYAPLQGIFPAAYLLAACLTPRERPLLRRLCALWAGTVAALGVGGYTLRAVLRGSGGRLEGLLGNPNATGIFLAAGWFALLDCLDAPELPPGWASIFRKLEPVLLAALAMTLSIGSFAALGAGLLWLLGALSRREGSLRAGLAALCPHLARAALGMGVGILFYLAAAHSAAPWFCGVLLCYLAAAAFCWGSFDRILRARPREAALFAAMFLLLAAAAVLLRPSSLSTLAERLEMIRNGLGYLTASPLLGVGPYRWRLLNMTDPDRYFNTWHIHNIPLHIGVETGWVAMLAVLVLALRALGKKGRPFRKAGIAAFCFQNLGDTGFFYLGILALVLLAFGDPRAGGRRLGRRGAALLFGGMALFFAGCLGGYLLE